MNIKNTSEFPIQKTRTPGVDQRFDLNDLADRKQYFEAKVSEEIKIIRAYLEKGTFVAYLIGKKNAGKGTYTKLFMEAVGMDNIGHIAVGDIVRDIHENLSNPEKHAELQKFFEDNYRGFHPHEELEAIISGRSTTTLIPSELIVALLKYEIEKRPKQALFIDGFPRALDQVGYAIFLKDLIGYRDDPDFAVFISVPEAVIDERIKYRVICPKCKTPRNLRLLATKDVGYDTAKQEFYLMCDGPDCDKARMVTKEGDQLGIDPIRERLEVDDQIFNQLLSLHGIKKVYLRNAVPAAEAEKYIDDYEITPGYDYVRDDKSGNIKTVEKPWTIDDDAGVSSYSLLPAAVVVSLIKQVAELLK